MTGVEYGSYIELTNDTSSVKLLKYLLNLIMTLLDENQSQKLSHDENQPQKLPYVFISIVCDLKVKHSII